MTAPKVGASRRGNAGKGRPKGSPNKVTASIKAALQNAFDDLGGVPSLVKWGKGNPSEFYALWGRLIPKEHEHSGDGLHAVAVRFVHEGRRVTAS